MSIIYNEVILCKTELSIQFIHTIEICVFDSLVFNLEVQMSQEPISEPIGVGITSSRHLHGGPVLPLIKINLHWNVTDLSGPREPMTLQEPIHRNGNVRALE